MTREQQLEFCSVCLKRDFDPKQGIVCGITSAKPEFVGSCEEYEENERAVYHEQQKKNSLRADTKKGINRGRYALFIVGGLYLIIGYYEAFMMFGHQLAFGFVDWAIAAIFIGLGVWSYRKASLALIIGLIVYVGLIVLIAAFDPSTLVKGIIWKILIISALVTSIGTARSDEAKEKLESNESDLLDQV
jgi:hypothetical protein